MIRGIGPVYARKPVRGFAEQVFDIIEAAAERLREVDGIGEVRAKRIVDAWADLDALVPAYAATIHKAQGSEYPAAVIPVLTQHCPMLQRNLLYTGCSPGLARWQRVLASRTAGRGRWSARRSPSQCPRRRRPPRAGIQADRVAPDLPLAALHLATKRTPAATERSPSRPNDAVVLKSFVILFGASITVTATYSVIAPRMLAPPVSSSSTPTGGLPDGGPAGAARQPHWRGAGGSGTRGEAPAQPLRRSHRRPVPDEARAIGVVLERLVFRRLVGAGHLDQVLATFGIILLAEEGVPNSSTFTDTERTGTDCNREGTRCGSRSRAQPQPDPRGRDGRRRLIA